MKKVFLSGILIGVIFGSLIFKQSAPSPENESTFIIPDHLKQKLEKYEALNEEKEKYQLANQIYADVFKLYLSMISDRIHMSQLKKIQDSKPFEKNIEKEYDFPNNPSNEIPKEVSNDINNEPEVFHNEETSQFEEKEFYSIPPSHKVQEKSHSILKINNPSSFKGSAIDIKKRNYLIKNLVGRFEGKILLDSKIKDEKIWYLAIEANLIYEKGKYQGSTLVEMRSDKRGNFSTSRGEGGLNGFQINQNRKNVLLIESSPHSYIAIKYSKRLDSWAGDYYEKNKESGSYQWVGRVIGLKRF